MERIGPLSKFSGAADSRIYIRVTSVCPTFLTSVCPTFLTFLLLSYFPTFRSLLSL